MESSDPATNKAEEAGDDLGVRSCPKMAAALRAEGEHGRKEEKGRCDLGLAAAELICSGGALLVGAPDGSRQREAERWCLLAHGTAALDRGTPSFDLDRAQGGRRRDALGSSGPATGREGRGEGGQHCGSVLVDTT